MYDWLVDEACQGYVPCIALTRRGLVRPSLDDFECADGEHLEPHIYPWYDDTKLLRKPDWARQPIGVDVERCPENAR